MNREDFFVSMKYLMTSKNKKLDNEVLKVWFTILIENKNYSDIQINYAIEKLIFMDNDFPTISDIVTIIEPKVSYKLLANEAFEILLQENDKNKIATRLMFLLFDTWGKFIDQHEKNPVWTRKDFIELYIEETKREEYTLQIAECEKKLIK